MANFQLVPTTVYYTDILTDAINPALAAPTILAAAKQGLSNAAFTPGVGTTFADTPAPGWTGYAQSATIVWEVPVNEPNGGVTSFSPANLFRATAVAVPENVFGGILTDGVASPGTGILASYKITPSIPIQNPGDGLSVQIAMNLGPDLTRAYAAVNV